LLKPTKTEGNLLWRLEHGYQLETDPLGGGLLQAQFERQPSGTRVIGESAHNQGIGRSGIDSREY